LPQQQIRRGGNARVFLRCKPQRTQQHCSSPGVDVSRPARVLPLPSI
jgi:hypothetical protein